MSAALPEFAMATQLLEDIHYPHQNLCQGITHVSAPLMLSMHTAQNFKASMPYFWPSKAFVLSIPLPLDQSLWDAITWEPSTKPNITRSSHHVAQPMQIWSEQSIGSIDPSPALQVISNM